MQNNPKWYGLDNAAKLYPAVRDSDWGAVFRLACYLKDPIDPPTLQQALEKTLARFPCYAVALRRGFFWYYHEKIMAPPLAVSEQAYPCMPPDTHDNNGYLFRVTYFRNRIAVDFFHSLTDGTGASVFLKTLTAAYLGLQGISIPAGGDILDLSERPDPQEAEDAFARYAKIPSGGSFKEAAAFTLSGESEPPPFLAVFHGLMDSSQVSAAAKKMDCTITAFLVSALMLAFDAQQRKVDGIPQLPVKISIPVNMRKTKPSKTLRNFSLFTNASLPPVEEVPRMEEVVPLVKAAMANGFSEEALDSMMALNVATERSGIIRGLPLFLKRAAIRAAFTIMGDNQISASLSNLGAVSLPEAMESRISRFDFILGRARRAGLNCGVVGYQGKLNVTISCNTLDCSVARNFYRILETGGIAVELAVSGLEPQDSTDPVRELYPPEDGTQARKKRHRKIIRLAGRILPSFGGFLVILNALTNPGGIWAAYPVAGLIAAWMLWRLPRNLPKPRVAYTILLAEFCVVSFLGMSAALAHSTAWFFGYAAPIAVVVSSLALGFDAIIHKRALKKSYAPFLINAVPGVLCLPAAMLSGRTTDRVSSILALMFSVGSLVYIAYKGRKWLRPELRRKLFR